MAKYSPKDIFNADECGLFYNMLPDKTYIFKGASCKDIKVNIKRLIILVCANWDGTSELSLLVTGLSKQPHYLKIWSVCHPPTVVIRQPGWHVRSSMNFSFLLIGEWHQRKAKYSYLSTTVLLTQQMEGTLKTCKWFHIPVNMTSVLQSMHQGIIRALKQKFHRSFVLRWLQET